MLMWEMPSVVLVNLEAIFTKIVHAEEVNMRQILTLSILNFNFKASQFAL